MAFTRITFLGLPLDAGVDADDIIAMPGGSKTTRLVTFIGPEAWALAKKNPTYPDMLGSMSLVVVDGFGVALACLLLAGHKCLPVSFDMTSLAKSFFATAAEKRIPLTLVGGQPREDEDAREKLVKAFPDITIVDTIHGYGEFEPKVTAIMGKAPGAVVVSMESPRQEEFMLALRDAGYRGIAVGAGSFIENYASDIDYQDFPTWVGDYYLTPFYKLYKDPKRLWQRYYFGYRYFVFVAAAEAFKRARAWTEATIKLIKKQ
jgi:N-acetylglucosaminyldiphosphoundecaprenol N-acetyl-beta-D-mannosaminyltransferase